jgi:hypothetical protein
MPEKSHSYEITLRPEIRVKGWIEGGCARVCVIVPTEYGDLCLQGSYPLAKIAAKFAAKWRQMGLPMTASGGFFSSLKKLTKKIAVAKALAPVLAATKAIQKNPVLARAVGLTTAVIPGAGAARKAVESAANLVQSAAKNPLALAKLKRLKSLAAMGLPQAVSALKVAQNAYKAIAAQKPLNFLAKMPGELANTVKQATDPLAKLNAEARRVLAVLPPGVREAAQAALAKTPPGAALQAAELANQAARQFAPPRASGEDESGAKPPFRIPSVALPLLASLSTPQGPLSAGAFYGC